MSCNRYIISYDDARMLEQYHERVIEPAIAYLRQEGCTGNKICENFQEAAPKYSIPFIHKIGCADENCGVKDVQ